MSRRRKYNSGMALMRPIYLMFAFMLQIGAYSLLGIAKLIRAMHNVSNKERIDNTTISKGGGDGNQGISVGQPVVRTREFDVLPYMQNALKAASEFNERHQYFREEDLGWMVELIVSSSRSEPERGIDLLIRKRGRKLSPDEVKALGFRRNKVIHDGYWNALTAKGREADDPSGELVSHIIKCLPSVQTENHKKMLEDKILAETMTAELLTADNDISHRTCSASLKLAEKKIPIKDAPFLPLKACDQSCACVYIYEPRR